MFTLITVAKMMILSINFVGKFGPHVQSFVRIPFNTFSQEKTTQAGIPVNVQEP